MTSPDSEFFLPLKGHENSSRLEAKFEHYFDSDNEDDSKSNQSQLKDESIGKVSEWKPSPQGTWLKSPVKTRRKCVVASGGSARYSSPKYRKRVEKQLKKSVTEKHQRKSTQTSSESIKVSPIPSLSKKSRLTIHEYSSEDEEEVNQDISKRGRKVEASNKCQVEKQSPRTPIPSDTTMHDELGDKIISVWQEFSETDTERPKLPVEPVSAKLDFVLSEVNTQPRIAVPASINQYLRDYQREGIRFLFEHYMRGTGAILGDDMGLGKTVQVIGFLSALLGKSGKHTDSLHAVPKFIKQMSNDFPDTPPRKATHPFLIIGPTAVVYNWLDELNTWGYFTVGKFHGQDKESCLADLKKGKLEVVVTTFETYRDKVDQLNQIEWEAVIVDEVHKIKGLRAQVTQALRIIHTLCRFGLTGTALQNNMTELWSLLDWAQPKVLGSLEQFENGFVRAIEMGQKHDATKRELAHARKQRDKFASIRKKMLLRRTKKLIADQLPQKEELVVICRLTDLQVSVYKAILDHPDMRLVLQAEDPCNCDSGKQRASCCYKRRSDGTKVWGLVFSFMHLMLKAANHVGLLIPESGVGRSEHQACLCDSDDEPKDASLSTVKEKPGAALARSVFLTAFKDQAQFVELTRSAAFRTLSDPRYCGKMKILQGLLRVFEKNHDKVLIFSYSTKLLDIIEHYVISQGHEYSRIDGKVSAQKRRDIVLKFNTDPSLFICLISTKAGGLGLNLTGANKVVIFDPNWNPSHDLQAQDRAYRIGQTRDVRVFRLVSAGTIEENIYLRQIYKQQLDEVAVGNVNARRYFHGVQGDKANQGELFGVKNMFALRTGNVCLTMDILKRNERLEKGLEGYDITKYVPPTKASNDENDEYEEDEESSVHESYLDDEKASDEEKEEDENFLRDIFGVDRIGLKPSSSTGEDLLTPAVQENQTCSYSDSDDELSLIPIKRHKNKGSDLKQDRQADESESIRSNRRIKSLGQSTEGYQGSVNTATTDFEASTSTASNAFDELFDMSDITFSTSRVIRNSSRMADSDKPPKDLDESLGVTVEEKNSSSKYTGLSWLLDDSVDESNENNGDKEEPGLSKGSPSSVAGKVEGLASKKRARVNNPQRKTNVKNKLSPPRRMKATFSTELSFLAGSDILHTHANTGVLGTSRAEDHMTRCAIKDVYELNTNTQAPALLCDPLSQPDEEENEESKQTKGKRGRKKKNLSSQDSSEENYDKRQSIKAGRYKLLIGQTPPAIARKQFNELARSKGMSEQEFALYVTQSSLDCRLETLRKFYTQKHPHDAVVEALEKVYSAKTITKDSKSSKDKTLSRSNEKNLSAEQLVKSILAQHRQSPQKCPIRGDTPGPSTSTKYRKSKGRPSPEKPRRTVQPCSSRIQTPFFLEPATFASDSQESITAMSPCNNGDEEAASDSNSASQVYQPVSPPPKRRFPLQHPSRVSPSKSQHRTRLRYRGEDGVKKRKSPILPQEYQKMDGSVFQGLSFNQPDSSIARQTAQLCEDIPSLLYEMGHGKNNYYNESILVEPEKSPGPSKQNANSPNKPNSSKRQLLYDSVAAQTPKASEGMSGLVKRITPKFSLHSPAKMAVASVRKKPVSILDDIFGDSSSSSLKDGQSFDNLEDESKGKSLDARLCPNSSQKPKQNEPSSKFSNRETGPPRTITNDNKIDTGGPTSSSSRDKPATSKEPVLREDHPSTSKQNLAQELPKFRKGTPHTKSSVKTAGIPITDSELDKDEDVEFELFAAMITSSTFCEDSKSPGQSRSSKRRKEGEGLEKHKKSVKHNSNKRICDVERNAGVEFDDLENWGKFTTKQPAPNGSESLFS